MTRPAAVIYRCKLCRAEFSPIHVPDGMAVMAHVDEGGKLPDSPGGPNMTEVHKCSPRRWGVAEFVGVQFD